MFRDNVDFIQTFDTAGNMPYKLGVNALADMTHEEFRASDNTFKFPPNSRTSIGKNIIQAPEFHLPWTGERKESSPILGISSNVVNVTPLKISLNFSRVCGAKDPSLANLPSQLSEKQSKSKFKQSKSTVTGTPTIYRKHFLICINSLYKTKLFP